MWCNGNVDCPNAADEITCGMYHMLFYIDVFKWLGLRFNPTFYNISVIIIVVSFFLLVEKTGVLGENYWTAVIQCQLWSHNDVSSTASMNYFLIHTDSIYILINWVKLRYKLYGYQMGYD